MRRLSEGLEWGLNAAVGAKKRALRAKIESFITRGVLTAGDLLPSVRRLAGLTGLSKATIEMVYGDLLAEGLLTSRAGRGFFVSERAHSLLRRERDRSEAATAAVVSVPSLPDKAFEAEKALTWFRQHVNKPLSCRAPVMDLFPEKEWKSINARIARSPWQHTNYSTAAGFRPLRAVIADKILRPRGILCSEENIAITNGTINAMHLLSEILLQDGQTVALESPINGLISTNVRQQNLKIRWLPIDREGVLLTKADRFNCIVVTPANHVPTGIRMSTDRRRKVFSRAAEMGSWIVENDLDAEFSLFDETLPAIRSFEGAQNNTIFLSTFSNTIFPGLRLGFAVLPECLVGPFAGMRLLSDRFSSESKQAALAEFIQTGGYEKHVRKVGLLYQARRQFLVERLESRLADFGCLYSNALGTHVSFRLNDAFPDKEVVRELAQRGVVARACSDFDGDFSVNGLMLGFGTFSETEIDDAVAIIEDVLRTRFASKMTG